MKAWDFIKFYWAAETKFRVDSPFLFQFVTQVLEGGQETPYYTDLKLLRRHILQDHTKINLTPMGAGSKVASKGSSSVAKVARSSLSSPSQQSLLFRLVHTYQPTTILELGTSLGLSAIYQQLGNPNAECISIEGRSEIYELALQVVDTFKPLERKPLLILGTFDDLLPDALAKLGSLDYLFIDGDHRGEALLTYYQSCLPFLHEQSVVVIHDIYWSKDMQRGWQTLTKRPEISVAINLFHMGILFFRPDIKEKLDLKLVPHYWKPWMAGFFRT